MLFQDEQVEDGITLRVYRFDTKVPVMSVVVRMVGEKTDKATETIGGLRKDMKAKRRQALDSFIAVHKRPWWKKWDRPDKDEKSELSRLTNEANGDCFFDIPRFEGELMLAQICQSLKEKGLTLKPTTRRSNGELDEEIYHFV